MSFKSLKTFLNRLDHCFLDICLRSLSKVDCQLNAWELYFACRSNLAIFQSESVMLIQEFQCVLVHTLGQLWVCWQRMLKDTQGDTGLSRSERTKHNTVKVRSVKLLRLDHAGELMY